MMSTAESPFPPSAEKARKTHPVTWLVLLIIVIAALLYFASCYAGLLASRQAAQEALAVRVIHEINRCATAHKAKHLSYPSSLAVMGPAADGCLDAPTAAGKRGDYKFSYTPGSADRSDHIASYRAEAHPFEYRGRLTRSFYCDESGLIRFTDQHRSASANDPPLK
jgi:hypothetical protein